MAILRTTVMAFLVTAYMDVDPVRARPASRVERALTGQVHLAQHLENKRVRRRALELDGFLTREMDVTIDFDHVELAIALDGQALLDVAEELSRLQANVGIGEVIDLLFQSRQIGRFRSADMAVLALAVEPHTGL